MATNYINTINHDTKHFRSITWHDLHQTHIHSSVPFHLILDHSHAILSCDKIIRLIPKKRLVAYGTWNNKQVVVKLFYSAKKAKKNFKKESLGIKKLVQSCIPTPAVLWEGSAQQQKIYVLIFERIMDAVNLDILRQQTDITGLLPLLRSMIIELATQHVLGIVQQDLHLNNFLITENKIYSLDGSSITAFPGILPKEQSLEHLALFFAQLSINEEPIEQELFRTYTKARGWIIKKSEIDFFYRAKNTWIKIRWTRFKKKIQRHSTLFVRKKTPRSVIMYDRTYHSAEFIHFLDHPETLFQHPETTILKAGNSSTVIKAKINHHWFVIKRYNMKNFWHRLRRTFRASRAATAWCLSQRLRLFGIATAKPIAYIENRMLGCRDTSYFVMEYIHGPHAGEYFSNASHNDVTSTNTAHRILDLLAHLKKIHLMHHDLKMTNILIQHHHPVLIDLDGMKEYHLTFYENRAFQKEIQRFMKNWKNDTWVNDLFCQLLKARNIFFC